MNGILNMNEKSFDYINVIPLVDIMLVLLTIVLTTSTMVASGAIRLELPHATADVRADAGAHIIEISGSGEIYYDERLTDLTELHQLCSVLNPETRAVIRADKTLPLQQFVSVLDAVHLKHVSIQTKYDQ
jgi:biopolymer transport protein ExbD